MWKHVGLCLIVLEQTFSTWTSIHVCDEINKIDIVSWKSATLTFANKWIRLNVFNRGVAKGGPGTPNPIPLKLLRIKRVRSRHALRIRLIELWMSWMNWELRSINCYELVGYFGLQLARLCKNLVLRWRHLYRVPRTATRVANRPVYPGTSRISGPVSRVPAWTFPGRKMSRIFVKPRSKFFDAMRHQFTLNSIQKL